MKKFRKGLALLLCLALCLSLLAACAQQNAPADTTADTQTTAEPDTATEETPAEETTSTEKPTIKFWGKCIEYTSGPMMTDALEEKLADQYNIESIQIDWANMDTVIRTGIASNDPCDIYNYPASNMTNFADMAVDLTPYLDADPEFKACFSQAALDACTVDGKIVCLPWESNFSVILGNKEALEAAGVEIPEAWTMDEFMEACEKIAATGAFPFTNATDLSRGDWIYRNAMLSEVASAGLTAEFAAGELAWDGAESIRALEVTKALYDAGYMYPGEGAVTVKNDEAKAAFYQGKVLMMPEIAAGAKQTADGATDFTPVLIPWPSSGSQGSILGSLNCLFIPQNSKNIDAAVEVLKAYLSADIQAIHAAEGYIPANVNVEITDEFAADVVAQSATLGVEPPISAVLNDYRANSLLPDLVLNGGVEVAAANLVAAASAG